MGGVCFWTVAIGPRLIMNQRVGHTRGHTKIDHKPCQVTVAGQREQLKQETRNRHTCRLRSQKGNKSQLEAGHLRIDIFLSHPYMVHGDP